jgi:hypothetical protein
MPNNSREELVPLAIKLAQSRNIRLKRKEQMEPQIVGWVTDGCVWNTSRGSVIKVHERLENISDELECYTFRVSKLNRPEPSARGKRPDAVQF